MSMSIYSSIELGKQVTVEFDADFLVTPGSNSMDPWLYPDDPEEIELEAVEVLSAWNTLTGEYYPRHLMQEFHNLIVKTLLEQEEILYDLYYEETS